MLQRTLYLLLFYLSLLNTSPAGMHPEDSYLQRFQLSAAYLPNRIYKQDFISKVSTLLSMSDGQEFLVTIESRVKSEIRTGLSKNNSLPITYALISAQSNVINDGEVLHTTHLSEVPSKNYVYTGKIDSKTGEISIEDRKVLNVSIPYDSGFQKSIYLGRIEHQVSSYVSFSEEVGLGEDFIKQLSLSFFEPFPMIPGVASGKVYYQLDKISGLNAKFSLNGEFYYQPTNQKKMHRGYYTGVAKYDIGDEFFTDVDIELSKGSWNYGELFSTSYEVLSHTICNRTTIEKIAEILQPE